MNVSVVVHHEREEAIDIAAGVVSWLDEHGHDVRLPPKDADLVGLPALARPEERLGEDCGVAVAIGGDGTTLRTIDLVAASGVPVLGINVGHFGYLVEVEPADAYVALERFFTGAYQIEERMLLAVSVEATTTGVEAPPACALNEAVIEKTPMGHTVRLAVWIDGDPFITYNADGLIVATPTGSTAYSLSAGGPIMDPSHRGLVLTPVSPHSLFDRSLVFEADTRLRLEVVGPRPATLSVDGRNLGILQPGDGVTCTGAERTARLVTFGPRNFHSILRRKFGLSQG